MPRLTPSTLLAFALLTTGCGQIGPFGRTATFASQDRQLCVETALRRSPDMSAVELAFDRFELACERGDLGACSALGVMYEQGLGVRANDAMAFRLFDQACRGGNDAGCVNLGLAYVNGRGVAFDSRQAAELFGLGCAKGDPRGCSQLAELYLAGDGVPRDTTKAAQLYAISCDARQWESCYAVAKLHEDGTIGPDPVAAITFYEKACVAGYADACDRMDSMYTRPLPYAGAVAATPASPAVPLANR